MYLPTSNWQAIFGDERYLAKPALEYIIVRLALYFGKSAHHGHTH
jgi:hypothetical protein